MPPEICPCCGADVPRKAKACPQCGADENTGWSEESDAMSKDLLKRGFKFVGSTICYAFMQAVGMVNDHTVDCFRLKQLR